MGSKVLVTGAKGFIGKNLVVQLKQKEYTVIEFDIDNSEADLANAVSSCDSIIHLAGVNRPKDNTEFTAGNIELTMKLIELVKNEKRIIPFVLSSSIQAKINNPYGLSKKAAEEIVLDYISTGGQGCIYRLHNVYGKWSRPNYNTVVATFCSNISNNIEIRIDSPEKIIELVYIDDVVKAFIEFIEKPRNGLKEYQYIKIVDRISLRELADKLYYYKECLSNGVVPNFKNGLDKNLFSMYLSFNSKESIIYTPKLNTDNRGWLFEFIKSEEAGQIFVSTTKPGITRGNHYHHTKIEKFCVIKGKAEIVLRHIINNEQLKYNVSGNAPMVIHIPPGYTHNIKNIGDDDLIALFWANEIFNKEYPDTIYEEV